MPSWSLKTCSATLRWITLTRIEATSHAMGEVTQRQVIATSLVLIAVFVPVSFFHWHDRHSLSAILADHRVFDRHLGL